MGMAIPLRAALDRPDAPLDIKSDLIEAITDVPLFTGGAFVLWLPLAATDSVMVVPAAVVLFAALVDLTLRRMVPEKRLDDPELERRLARFARDMGTGPVDVRVMDDVTRSSRDVAPGVRIDGAVVLVPQELIDADYDVLETRLAEAIVRAKQWTRIERTIRVSLLALVLVLLVIVTEQVLINVSGASGVGDPAFLPAVGVLIASSSALCRPLVAFVRRARARNVLRDVMDLTRNPNGVLHSLQYDLDRGAVDQARDLMHLLMSSRLSADVVHREVEAWLASRRLCLAFTDIVRSTDLLDQVGDERWYDLLSEHDHVIRRRTKEFGGEEMQKAGDGFLLAFPQAGQAALAVIEMQRDLQTLREEGIFPATVRMGLHAGEVIRRGKELVGREVHLAARIGSAALGDEILVSQPVHAELAPSARFRFGQARTVSLKGFDDVQDVFPVLWDEPIEVPPSGSLANR